MTKTLKCFLIALILMIAIVPPIEASIRGGSTTTDITKEAPEDVSPSRRRQLQKAKTSINGTRGGRGGQIGRTSNANENRFNPFLGTALSDLCLANVGSECSVNSDCGDGECCKVPSCTCEPSDETVIGFRCIN